MRIAFFILGFLAAGYLIIKGFKQLLAERRASSEEKKPLLPDDE